MYYFQRVEERSKQARKTLKNCELAQRQKKFGFKEAVISSHGECTGCRNPDDGIFMLSITAAAKKADEEEDKLFCEYLKGKKME